MTPYQPFVSSPGSPSESRTRSHTPVSSQSVHVCRLLQITLSVLMLSATFGVAHAITEGIPSPVEPTQSGVCTSAANISLSVIPSASRVTLFEDSSVSVQVAIAGLDSVVGVCGNVLPVVLVYAQLPGGTSRSWRLIGSFEGCASDQIRLPTDLRSVRDSLLFRVEVDAYSDFGNGRLVVDLTSSRPDGVCTSAAKIGLSVIASASQVTVLEDSSVSVQVAIDGLHSVDGVCGNVSPFIHLYAQLPGGTSKSWRLIGSFEGCASDQIRLPTDLRSLRDSLLFRVEVDAFSDFGSGRLVFDLTSSKETPPGLPGGPDEGGVCTSAANISLSVIASASQVTVLEDSSVSVQVAVRGLDSVVDGVCGNVSPFIHLYAQLPGGTSKSWRLIGSFEGCASDQIRLPTDLRSLRDSLLFRVEVDAFSDFESGRLVVDLFNSPAFSLNQATGTATNNAIKPFGNFTLTSLTGDPLTSPVVTLFGLVFSKWLSGNVLAAQVHGPATASSDGPVVAVICAVNSSMPCSAVTAIPFSNLFEWVHVLSNGVVLNSTLLQNGLLYLSIRTTLNSGGELRGQLNQPCNGSCVVPFVPNLALLQPVFNVSSVVHCSLFECSFPFVTASTYFQSISIYCSSYPTSRLDGSFNIEFQQKFLLTEQSPFRISFDKFPTNFARGKQLFVQAVMDGPFGASSLSPVYTFVIPVVPTVQILQVDTQFESLMLTVAYPFTSIAVEFFEAFLLGVSLSAVPSSQGNITFFFDLMNSTFPRDNPLSLTVRAVLKTAPFLASDFTTFTNLSLPILPVPNVSSVLQRPSSFTVFVDALPQNLPSAIGFNFSFSNDSITAVYEIFKDLDTQFVFDQNVLTFLRDLNPNRTFVSLKTVFRQNSIVSSSSRPFKFLLMPPPSAPTSFAYQLYKGQQSCVNLSWVSAGSGLTAFKISIPPVPYPFFVDGDQRNISICSTLIENTIYFASISSMSNSGESPGTQLGIRFFMQPKLIFSSSPVPSFGLLPNRPSLTAVIFNFPVGLNVSSPDFGVYLRRTTSPFVFETASSVSIDAALDPAAATFISFRTPPLPDFCVSGICSAYDVDLCFQAPGNLSACSTLTITSVSTAVISQISKVSGPTKPRPFVDDIFVSIVRIDPLLLDATSNFVPNVTCVGASGHSANIVQFSIFDGTAAVRIVPPHVTYRTRMIFKIQLQNVGTKAFVPRVDLSFTYDAFDDPLLSDMFPTQATIDADTTVQFQIQSALITSANVTFAHKPATLASISNFPDFGGSAVFAKVPAFSLREASSCWPPSPTCAISINATLTAVLDDGTAATFWRRFQLVLPAPPRVQVVGSLIVDVNKLTTLVFSISDSKYLESVLIANKPCPFTLGQQFSTTVVSVQVEPGLFLPSTLGTVVFRSRVEPDYFTVNGSFLVDFRDFTQPSVESLAPAFGPLIGGTYIAIFTKEMSQTLFATCKFSLPSFDAPCAIIETFSNVSRSRDMPITFSEYWSPLASSTLQALIEANPSSVSSLGVSIIRVPAPPASPPFAGGNANITFNFASKSAAASYFYVPNPSTPAVVTSVLPSEVSELGGRTVQLVMTNLQVVDAGSSLECFLGATSAVAEVLDVKYVGTVASVVVLVPSLLPGLVAGTLGPKSNVNNRASFKLNILSSVPFVVDAFSVFPPVLYQDFAGNVSVRMTGVPSSASISNFVLLVDSFVIPRNQMSLVTSASRTDSSQLIFSILGFPSVSSVSSDAICTLQYNDAFQKFSITVLPTVPAASVASVTPTFGNSFGGSIISLSAARLRELVPPAQPLFYVDNVEVTSQITNISVLSDKFQTTVSFGMPPIAEGLRRVTVTHPVYARSNVSFLFQASLPVPRAEPQIRSIRRGANITLRVLFTNFVNISSLKISTSSPLDYVGTSSDALLLSALAVNSSAALITLILPPASARSVKSQVVWYAREGARNTSFSLTVEPSDVPLLASFSPSAVSAYGGDQLSFIVGAFEFPVVLRDWTCSFPFANVSAQSVTRIDTATISVLCVAPLSIQAVASSQRSPSVLVYQAADMFTFPFDVTFSAPPLPSLTFLDDVAQVMSDSASIFVNNFAPFSSIDIMRIVVGSVRVPIRGFIVRSGVLQLQFTVSCSECGCCTGETSILTVSHNQFPMMSASTPVVVVDPSAPAVLNVDPSVIPASGGTIVEIQIKNFPSISSAVTVSVGNSFPAPAVAFQLAALTASAVFSVRFFSPVLPSGVVGYEIRLESDSKPLVSVKAGSAFAITVSNIIISGQCSRGSLPAFGGVPVNCIVNNIPIPTDQGQLEFRYTLSNTTVFASSRGISFIQTSATAMSIDLLLPNVANRVFETIGIKLQIMNANYMSSIFSTNVDLVPSSPRVVLVDPRSSPNDKPVNAVAYVEFFFGQLFSVEALLDGSSMQPGTFRAEFVSASVTAFYFTLPKALSAGNHFISFWSGDVNKALSFVFTAVDALKPTLIRLQPSQGSTVGGDAVSISVTNFHFDQGSVLLLESSNFTSVGFFCQNDPQVCTINAISPPTQNAGLFNISLVTGSSIFKLPKLFATVQPAPKLDFCFPTIGLISGGANVTCYFMNIPSVEFLSVSNVSSRFDDVPGYVASATSVKYTVNSVFSVGLTAPTAVFEGNSTISVTIGSSAFSFFPFVYVRPCNFETFCPSRGLIPFDLRIMQDPPKDDVCSELFCLDPKVLPIPSIDLVSPSVVSTVGGTSVTLFGSNFLAVIASDISISIGSSRSSIPVSAAVTLFNAKSNYIVFSAPSLPFEGLFSVILSTRRSRQLVTGIKEVVTFLQYETPIVGKAAIASIFPTSVLHNTPTTLYISLKNFVPVAGSTQVLLSANGSLPSIICQTIFSSRSSTLVTVQLPAYAGYTLLNISIWNSLVSPSRSADHTLVVEAPPVPVVVSVFPDSVEAASVTTVNIAVLNVPASATAVVVKTRNGAFVASAVSEYSGGSLQFFQFALPNSKVSGSPLVFDASNALLISSSASSFSFSADFTLQVRAPARPQIILPPRFTSLLITDAPLASFVIMNFGGFTGEDSISASLVMGPISQALVVTSYVSDGLFGTVTVQFAKNVRLAGSAQVVIFSKAAGSTNGAAFLFTYVFPEPFVSPSLACTNGKSSGFAIVYAAFPDSIDAQNFQVAVNGGTTPIVSVTRLTISSVNLSIVFPAALESGTFPLSVFFSRSGNISTFRSSVQYFYPPTIRSTRLARPIPTNNKDLIPVKVSLKDFPSVDNRRFSITAGPYEVLVDYWIQATYESSVGSVITFYAPFGPPSGRLTVTIACTDTDRFPRAVLDMLVVQLDLPYYDPLPTIYSVYPSSVDMSRAPTRITVVALNFKVATSAQIFLEIGPRVIRDVSVSYSNPDATRIVFVVGGSDAPNGYPGKYTAALWHVLDNRMGAEFALNFVGQQTATCLNNCVLSAFGGLATPLSLVRLQYFPLVTQSNQLRCTVSTLSACGVQLVNSSSVATFILIRTGAVGLSTAFKLGVANAVVNVYVTDVSAGFGLSFLSPPSALSANFLTETSFQIVFDQIIASRNNLNSSCEMFQDYISLFGQGAACRMSQQTVTVEGGPSFSLSPGDSVTIVPGLIFGSAHIANSLTNLIDSASGKVAVLAPVQSSPPNVVYISPSAVGACDDLELRIADPTPRARYTWICLNDYSVTAAATSRTVDARMVKLLRTDLPRVNFGYKFVLSATSLFSQTANSSMFEVFKVSQAIPNIISSKQTSLITLPIVVTAQVEFSACPVPAANMVFEWSTAAADETLVKILKQSTGSTVNIPENTLAAGRTYVLSCTVFKSDEPAMKNVGKYTVQTLSSPLHASIAGGGRVISVLSELVMDASASFDPDFKAAVSATSCSATLSGGDGFIQIGNWRFGRVDDNHFSFSNNNGRTSVILRSDGTVHGGSGYRTDWGLSAKPLTWTYSASNPNALKSLPNVQFGRSYVQFGPNCRLGTPDDAHLSLSFKTPCCGKSGIHTADIWRDDGTIHTGPRTCCGLGQLNTFDAQLSTDSVWFGDKFLQIGNFRIADIDGNHMSIAYVSSGKTAEIFRSDSTQHPGPRRDFNANGRAKCPLRVYQDNGSANATAAAEKIAAAAALTFVWQCSMVQGDFSGACRNDNGVLLNLTSSPVLKFPPNSLTAGTSYTFSVSVFKTGRSASASATVKIESGSFIEDATLALASPTPVNAHQKVSIVCKSKTVITSYQWSISEVGKAAALSVKNQDPTGASFLLEWYTLEPGRDYKVAAVVTAKNRKPTTLSMTFSTNSPPSSGKCTVSPAEGISGVTQFTVACNGWVDVDGGITYYISIRDLVANSDSWNPLVMGQSMIFPSAQIGNKLDIRIYVFDKYYCATEFPLSVKLLPPPPVSLVNVGKTCDGYKLRGKYAQYSSCVESVFKAYQPQKTVGRKLLQAAGDGATNMSETSGTLLKVSVLDKLASAADETPLEVEALSLSYLQTITPLCSEGDLGNFSSSLYSCVSMLSRTSQTLLGKPISSGASMNLVSTAVGILASFTSNYSQSANANYSQSANASNSYSGVDAIFEVQKMLDVTAAAVYNSAQQAYLGDEPLSFVTPFSMHVASRTTLASLNGTISFPGISSSWAFATTLADQILGSESSGFTQPLSVIVESYNSTVRWASGNKTFVSGVHGLSFYSDSGPVVVNNLPSNCSINISIPLDSLPSQKASVSNYRCNYWDPATLGWKQDGCSVISMTQTHVTVSTSHLTQFGIEFQPPPPATTAAPPSTTAPSPPALPIPSIVLNPPYSRLGPVVVTVSTSSPIFDRFISECRIVFANLSSISSSITFESSTSVKCLVPASVTGRTVNISVTGIVDVSISFSQFESFVFNAVQWDAGLDFFTISSTSSLPFVSQFACNQLFAVGSVALFGTGSSCSMANRSIVVSVGSGCRLRLQQLMIDPTVRFFKTDVPSEIFPTALPSISFAPNVPAPTAAVDGPTTFGSCSAVSVKLIVYTAAKVVRASELMPSILWRFSAFQPLTNTTFSNISSVGLAVNQRLSGVNSTQFIFLSGSWQGYNFPTSSLPPGEYKVYYRAVTWFNDTVEGNATFSIIDTDAPVVSPIRVPVTVYRHQISQFTASVLFSTCSESTTPSYAWRVRNWANQVIVSSSKKTLSIPQYTLMIASNNTHFIELVVNGIYRMSSSFELSRLPPVVVISGGEKIIMASSGGRISAEGSYDPNFGPSEQPVLSYSWNCVGLGIPTISSSTIFCSIPAIASQIACTVTVNSIGAGAVSRSANVVVVPVAGSPPSLTISSSLPRVAFGQNLALNVIVSPGVDSQYKFDWSASNKSLQASDALTSLQSPSLVVKGSFFADVTAAVKFTCRVTNILTSVVAEASMSIAVNSPPECGGAVLSVTSEECVGDIGSGCPVTAMQTKLRVMLSDVSGLTAMCSDADAPVKYRLLAFTTSCSSTSKGQVLSSSAAPSFASISVASGVRSLGIEATDSLGATFRTCSSDISVNAASAAALTGIFQSASSSLAGDSEAQKRLVSNVAGSLSSLYASANGNTALLDSVKAQALSFLNASSSTEITDAGDATQAVSSLNALVTLPGAMSAAQTASAVSMFGRFATSSLALLASGAATVDFAIEVAPILVGGSLNVFEKTVSTSSSRRILAYKTGMDAAYSAIVSAAKVQAFALAASQDAVVTEQAPVLVQGVRRLRSVSALAAIIPPSSLFGVAVSVAPDADASSVVDVGVAVAVQATSPFQDAGSAVLISPIVAVASFNAATGAPISSTRNIVEAKFPVSQSSHDARVVANAAGQRKGEGCVVHDGTRWSRSCATVAYSSSSHSLTCACNVTAATLAIAAAEFVVDCSGAFGGSLVLDACKTCGGSIKDVSECSPLASVNGAVIGGIVGGCLAISIVVFAFWLRRRRAQILVSKESTPTDFKASLQLPSGSLQPPSGHRVSASIGHHNSESLRIKIRPISKPHGDVMPSSSQFIRYIPRIARNNLRRADSEAVGSPERRVAGSQQPSPPSAPNLLVFGSQRPSAPLSGWTPMQSAGHISPNSNTAATPHFNRDNAVDEVDEILPGTPSRSVPRK